MKAGTLMVLTALLAGPACAPVGQAQTAQDAVRFASHGFSEKGLMRVSASMDPAMQSLALRHDPGLRRADLWARSPGWGSLDLDNVPTLGFDEQADALVARAIALDGHDIVTAQDGAEALEILTAQDGAFDLLLTDIKMPVMDGIALALAAARDFPDLTILLMTGFADQRERASGLNAIVHDVVTKPFSVAAIADGRAQGAERARRGHPI
eukprot:gene3788-5180_t